jgi:Na+:H+ antiporter, NhaA family
MRRQLQGACATSQADRADLLKGTGMQVRAQFQGWLRHDAAGGVVLLIAAALALAVSNSPFGWLYSQLLDMPVALGIAPFRIVKPLLLWINDGLMVLFFLLVGLELKRELVAGALSSRRQAALPVIAAIGGMVVPAIIYCAVNWGVPANLRGWAIPAATDIAFAVGVLALLGGRVPASLKVFLLALAIIDDLGAIIIIAVFYTQDLSPAAFGLGVAGAAALWGMNRADVRTLPPYLLVGAVMWLCLLKSGVHATLAGVVLAFAIPLRSALPGPAMLERLEHGLKPWVVSGVAPLFAFANAGVSLAGITPGIWLSPLPAGIAAGLFLGKQAGIFGSTWLAVRMGLADKPDGTSWRQIYGTAVLGGIGFTMSLFIGSLAFPDPASALPIRLGVLAGSLASAVLGYAVLRRS